MNTFNTFPKIPQTKTIIWYAETSMTNGNIVSYGYEEGNCQTGNVIISIRNIFNNHET